MTQSTEAIVWAVTGAYKVKLKDSDGKTIAKFNLDREKWKPFAEKVSSKLNKKLIEGK